MSVKPRGDSWQAYVSVNNVKKRKSFATKQQAEAWEVAARKALLSGLTVPSMGSVVSSTTLESLSKSAYRKYWKGSKAETKTMLNVKAMLSFFGTKTSISEVTTEAIDNYIATLQDKGNSNATINRKLAVVSKILKLALHYGHIESLPQIERFKENEGRIRWITKEEEQVILKVMEDWEQHDLRDAFIVSIDVGCRFGELQKIEHTDILPEGVYLADRKASNHSVIPLTERAREVLERRSGYLKGRLFPYSGYWIRNMWDRIKNHLELHDVVWHTLRHTTCSRLVQGGMPLTHVKEWMGHKSIQTTMRYSHLSTSHLTLGVDLLQAV